jgi:membrane-associated phospholipid phosphatase
MSEDTRAHVNETTSPDRRKFLGQFGGATAATVAAATVGLEPLLGRGRGAATAMDIGNITGAERADRAMEIRMDSARRERAVLVPAHPDNRDEERFANRIGNYSKGLRHDAKGEVFPAAYDALLGAIRGGRFSDFEALQPHLGCPDVRRQRPLVNPEAGNSFDLQGSDPAQMVIPPAPPFDSAERAAEMAELYWMALLRDLPFDLYSASPAAQFAAADLTNMPGFKGPRDASGRVTPQTLFRDLFPGCTVGPYISQFLIRQSAFGAQRIDQRIQPRAIGVDYLTDLASWLDVQNGCQPAIRSAPAAPNTPLRFVATGRDLGHYVHIDLLYQAYFVAMVVLLNGVTINEATNPEEFLFPLDRNNPYGRTGATTVQGGFANFGNPHVATLVTEPSTRALKAVWYQKWRVHRNLRPEAFGGRVEIQRLGRATYPIHPDLYNRSTVLPFVLRRYGTHLLSQPFPEGSPLHPSYGSGHATVAGACVTMLKAFFDEDTVFPEPQVVNLANGGQTIVPYTGADRGQITVGGELNKLASNIATGRNHGGVHWRSDAVEAMRLGERVAISMLSDMFETYGEPFEGFRLTKFDGTRVVIRDNPRV